MDVAGTQTVPSLLRQQVERNPDKIFLVFENDEGVVSSFSYGNFAARVNRLANYFSARGIAQGETVAVMLANCPEFLVAWFAINQVGAIMVPINVLYSADELAYLLNNAGCTGFITEPSFLAQFRAVEQNCPTVRVNVLAGSNASEAGFDLLSEIEATGDGSHRAAVVSPRSVAQIIYTSGTTSRPKGAVISHRSTVLQGIATAMLFGMTANERSCVVLPLFHVNGQYVGTIPILTVGGTVVLLRSFSARRFWAQIKAHRCTLMSIVPMLLRTMLAQPPRDDEAEHSLRFSFYALPTSTEEWTAFETRFNVRLIEGYGLSETLGICTSNPLVHGAAKRHCIGLPVLGREIRVVNDQWEDMPVGESGAIVVRGEPLFSGYFRNEEATRACFHNGYFSTGDNGWFDEDGYLHFLDRSKDVIKRAGENIAAGEVERVLNEHPAVAESAVIGIFDPLRDEAVKAYVVLKPGAEASDAELQSWCATYLAKFKVPSVIEYRSDLPKTSIGKIMKYKLRAEHASAAPSPAFEAGPRPTH
jgi:crotonobetaine/carnitine-CoA ligase